ncbi:MAG TPA: glyoxalase [Thiothrix sp.]|nr:glyoxalase [Thiothrix sp.]
MNSTTDHPTHNTVAHDAFADNCFAIHHVSFLVSDLPQALQFYIDILGLTQNPHRPALPFAGAWLDINPNQQIHLLVLPNPDASERPEHGGRDRHLALFVQDLSVIRTKLQATQQNFTESQSGRPALFCRDPDGNTIELIEQAPQLPTN